MERSQEMCHRCAQWAFNQIRKIVGCAYAGNVFPTTNFKGNRSLVTAIHHGTCVTHGSWCMSGSLPRGGGESVPGIPGACNPQFYVFGKSPTVPADAISRYSTCSLHWVALEMPSVTRKYAFRITDLLLRKPLVSTNVPVTWSFSDFFAVSQLLKKQSSCWWFCHVCSGCIIACLGYNDICRMRSTVLPGWPDRPAKQVYPMELHL